MAVGYLDLNAYQNEDFDADVALNKYISNAAFDASDFRVFGELRKHYLSRNTSAVFNINSPTNGKNAVFNISLTSKQTSQLKPGKYIYDVFVEDRSRNIAKYSYYFPGNSTDYIDINQPNIINSIEAIFKLENHKFCIDFWIFPLSLSGNIIKIGTDGMIIFIEYNKIKLKYQNNIIIESKIDLKINEWQKVRVGRDVQGINMINVIIINDQDTATNSTAIDYTDIPKTFTIGNDFTGYISNLRIIRDAYPPISAENKIFPYINPTGETVLLTCRDSKLLDNGRYNFKLTNATNNIKPDLKSPFTSDITTYKILEGAFFMNPSVSKFQ